MAPFNKNKPTQSDDTMTRRKKAFFKQRFPAFKKKATELSVLCGNSVGFICYGPEDDKDLHVWPENPKALKEIVAKFNKQSDLKRERDGCDLSDFANLESFSVSELKNHLSDINSHLIGVRQKKFDVVMNKTKNGSCSSSEQDRPRVSENKINGSNSSSEEDHVRVSEKADDNLIKVSDQREDATKLGFGGVFDELGYVVRGCTDKNQSGFELKPLEAPEDDRALCMDPVTLWFSGGETELYPMIPGSGFEVSCNARVRGLEFSTTYAESFLASIC